MNKKIMSLISSIIMVIVIALSLPSYSYAASATYPSTSVTRDDAVYIFWDNVIHSADEGYMWYYSDGINSISLILGDNVGYYYSEFLVGSDGNFYTRERSGDFGIYPGTDSVYGDVLLFVMNPGTNAEWLFEISSFNFDSETPYFTLIDAGNSAGEFMLTTDGQYVEFPFYKKAINFG